MIENAGIQYVLADHLSNVASDVIECIQKGEYCALLGPHSSGKSDVLQYVHGWLQVSSRPCLYVDLREINELSETSFFSALADATNRACLAAGQDTLPRLDVYLSAGRAYGNALAETVRLLDSDIVLLLDHLDMIPNDLARSLLETLRAVYQQQTTSDCRLIVVVAGALSLAALAVGSKSPFHNIARTVLVGDLTEEQSSRLITQRLADAAVSASPAAHLMLLEATIGDPGLIRRLCRICLDLSTRISKPSGLRRLYRQTVKRALHQFLAEDARAYRPLQEGIDLVEDDPDLLQCVLMLLKEPSLRRSELPLPLISGPDPLYLTGLVRQTDERYQIRNLTYRLYLAAHFDPGLVGHLLTMAGRWDEAIDHLTESVRNGRVQYRTDLLAASVNSMRASRDLHEAVRFLARGLADAFSITDTCIWQALSADAVLLPLWPLQPAESWRTLENHSCDEIPFHADRIEARAYREARPLRGPVNEQGFVLRAFPLLTAVEQPVGVVALVDSQAVASPAVQHERDLELQSYLAQAASALHDLIVYREREEARRELADTLRDITKTLSRTLEPEEVMNAVLKQMARVLPFDTASIQWPEATGLRIIAGHGFGKPGIDQITFPYSDEFPNVLVWKRGKSLRYGDVQQEFTHFKDPKYQVERVHGWLGVPLLEGEKTVGVLTLDSFAMDRYGPEHEQVATIFASIAAVALGNALLYDQQRRRARDLETLTEVAEEFSANVPGSAPILDLLVRSACRITGCNCAVVYPFLPGQMVYDTDHIAAFGLLQPKMFSPHQKFRSEDTSLAASVVAHGQRIVYDVYTDCDAERLTSAPFIKREKIRAFVGISLQASKETLGVLFANYRQPQSFNDDDLDTIHRFANLASFAILNARLYQRSQDDLQRRIKRMNTLREIDDAISSTLDLQRTLSLILDRTLEHIQAPYGTIQLVSSDGSVLELVTYRGATLASSGAGLARGEGVTGRAWANTKTYYVPDVHAPEWADIYTAYIPGMDSELAVPMTFEGQVVGVINIEKPHVNAFSADDIEFVESLAQQAAIAIRNAISYVELEKTKTHLVAAEAVAWLGLLGADWQHTIHQKTFSIDNYTRALRQGLAKYSLPSGAESLIDEALKGIEGVVDKIRNAEFTSKIPAGPIDRSGAATLVDEKLPQMITRWCAVHPDIVVDSSLNCSGVCAAIPAKWLEVAMEKLVHNALKAMPSGGQLTYRTYCSNDKVSITVKDSGHGIPEDVRHIFLKETVKRQIGEGTGMGALIARFIALVYEGDLLLVDSHPERGTELRMILPTVQLAVQPGE